MHLDIRMDIVMDMITDTVIMSIVMDKKIMRIHMTMNTRKRIRQPAKSS